MMRYEEGYSLENAYNLPIAYHNILYTNNAPSVFFEEALSSQVIDMPCYDFGLSQCSRIVFRHFSALDTSF